MEQRRRQARFTHEVFDQLVTARDLKQLSRRQHAPISGAAFPKPRRGHAQCIRRTGTLLTAVPPNGEQQQGAGNDKQGINHHRDAA